MKMIFLALMLLSVPVMGTEWLQKHGIYVYPKGEPDPMAQYRRTDVLWCRYHYGLEASYRRMRLTCLLGSRWDEFKGEPDSGVKVDILLFRYIRKF